MARVTRRGGQRRGRQSEILPLERYNYLILGAGVLCIIAGYIALLEKTVDGFLPLVVAPILLVLGYCVLVPIGILYYRKPRQVSAGPPTQ